MHIAHFVTSKTIKLVFDIVKQRIGKKLNFPFIGLLVRTRNAKLRKIKINICMP